jgi:hypothetical protein
LRMSVPISLDVLALMLVVAGVAIASLAFRK